MSTWIDFRMLRERLSFAELLTAYRVSYRKRGEDQVQGYCPLPKHQSRSHGAKPRSMSFSVNFRKGSFCCFSCKGSGNALDFVAMMENLDPSEGQQLRKAALIAIEKFPQALRKESRLGRGRDERLARAVTERKVSSGKRSINPPLDFNLRDLDPRHPYLFDRGFSAEVIEHFGLGYCNRGLLKGRIAIPLVDQMGRLVGYAGRLTDDSLISAERPKYLFPGTRERDDVTIEFRKSLLVYGANEIKAPVDRLVVVEGFAAVWWLWDAGITNVVAIMGSNCSKEQGEIIVSCVKLDGHVLILPDGDSAGRDCASSTLIQVAKKRWARWVALETSQQPTDLDSERLHEFLM